eukprot:SAG31_NODE_1694_length_7509_cov_14.080432_6_plen_720_part_00
MAARRCVAAIVSAALLMEWKELHGTVVTGQACTADGRCERRCRGPAALRPGYGVCLPPERIDQFRGTDDLVWDAGHFPVPPNQQGCHLGTYFADDGQCPLRIFSKADILNCRRQEMLSSNKRNRIIFLGGSSTFNMVKALLDSLEVRPPYNESSPGRTWAGDWASATLDVIFDADMNLRYIKEGSGDLDNGIWFPLSRDLRSIQDAPDYGPGSVRITWFALRFGADLDNAMRLSMGLRAVPSPVYNSYDLGHADRGLNRELNEYEDYVPQPGSRHYAWTNENEVIIDVHVETAESHPTWKRFRRPQSQATQVQEEDMGFMRQWLIDIQTPEVRRYLPLRSVIWADTFPQHPMSSYSWYVPGQYIRSPASYYMENAIREMQQNDANASRPNQEPYFDFHHQHLLGKHFEDQHGYKLHNLDHAMNAWNVWMNLMYLHAICEADGGALLGADSNEHHISECGSWGRFREQCYVVGDNWRDNMIANCQLDHDDMEPFIGTQHCNALLFPSSCGPDVFEDASCTYDSTGTDDSISDPVPPRPTAAPCWIPCGCRTEGCECSELCATNDVSNDISLSSISHVSQQEYPTCVEEFLIPDAAWLLASVIRTCDPNWTTFTLSGALILVVLLGFFIPESLAHGGCCKHKTKQDAQAAETEPLQAGQTSYNTAAASVKPTGFRVDTESLTGMRGFAAFHVAFNHHASRTDHLGFYCEKYSCFDAQVEVC